MCLVVCMCVCVICVISFMFGSCVCVWPEIWRIPSSVLVWTNGLICRIVCINEIKEIWDSPSACPLGTCLSIQDATFDTGDTSHHCLICTDETRDGYYRRCKPSILRTSCLLRRVPDRRRYYALSHRSTTQRDTSYKTPFLPKNTRRKKTTNRT